ncbi:MAG: flagellar brake protein [Deferribacterales bacterium]
MEKIKDYKNFLQLNTKVNISVRSGSYQGVYDSRIEDLRGDGIYISLPTLKGVPFPILPGTEVEVSFIASGGRFSFDTKVEGRVVDGIPMLKLKKPEYIYRSELRKFFRVDCRLKIKIHRLFFEKLNGDIIFKVNSYDALVKDISGGGVRLQTEIELVEDDIIQVDLTDHFPTINEIFGRVVTVFPKVDKKYEYGVEFISIRERDRDLIVKYVFRRQIELKKLT